MKETFFTWFKIFLRVFLEPKFQVRITLLKNAEVRAEIDPVSRMTRAGWVSPMMSVMSDESKRPRKISVIHFSLPFVKYLGEPIRTFIMPTLSLFKPDDLNKAPKSQVVSSRLTLCTERKKRSRSCTTFKTKREFFADPYLLRFEKGTVSPTWGRMRSV